MLENQRVWLKARVSLSDQLVRLPSLARAHYRVLRRNGNGRWRSAVWAIRFASVILW